MFQKISKTLYYMKIMVCKIPPGGGAEPFLAPWPNLHVKAAQGDQRLHFSLPRHCIRYAFTHKTSVISQAFH